MWITSSHRPLWTARDPTHSVPAVQSSLFPSAPCPVTLEAPALHLRVLPCARALGSYTPGTVVVSYSKYVVQITLCFSVGKQIDFVCDQRKEFKKEKAVQKRRDSLNSCKKCYCSTKINESVLINGILIGISNKELGRIKCHCYGDFSLRRIENNPSEYTGQTFDC